MHESANSVRFYYLQFLPEKPALFQNDLAPSPSNDANANNHYNRACIKYFIMPTSAFSIMIFCISVMVSLFIYVVHQPSDTQSMNVSSLGGQFFDKVLQPDLEPQGSWPRGLEPIPVGVSTAALVAQTTLVSTPLELGVVLPTPVAGEPSGQITARRRADTVTRVSTLRGSTELADWQLRTLMDDAVAIDSQFWSGNRYNRGSMRFDHISSRSPNGTEFVARGYYIYDGNQVGWVDVRFTNNVVSCLAYYNLRNTCQAPADQREVTSSTRPQPPPVSTPPDSSPDTTVIEVVCRIGSFALPLILRRSPISAFLAGASRVEVEAFCQAVIAYQNGNSVAAREACNRIQIEMARGFCVDQFVR